MTGGVGVAGIGAGAVFSALSHNADDASTCAHGVIQCTPARSGRAGYSDAATVSYAVGGTLLATGITLFVLAPALRTMQRAARATARLHRRRPPAARRRLVGRLQLEGAW